MNMHDTYIGIEPFGVLIDESSELEGLVSQARELKELPFEEKLKSLKDITIKSMVNAYEQWKTNLDEAQREFYKNMVTQTHPLSEALQKKAGCCRYQGALLFTLGYEADLGDIHFIQQAPVDPVSLESGGMRSVFNDVVHNGKLHHVSIFKESLQDESLDYSKNNPRVFESAIGFGWPKDNPCSVVDPWKMKHYSYHRTDSGLVIVSEDSTHIKKFPVDKK
jgi:hypothetical protein|tara:strand:+ start:233 stop:895 length:663 start_codon:yes stop_codon:yes gene_type:complete